MAKIIIVDDSETLRRQIIGELGKYGHEFVEAVDGQHGLVVIKDNPDAQFIFSDVNMPEMDGLTMCEKAQAEGLFEGKRVFMITTESSAEMKSRGKAAGVIAWLTKPINPEKVQAAIVKLLGQ